MRACLCVYVVSFLAPPKQGPWQHKWFVHRQRESEDLRVVRLVQFQWLMHLNFLEVPWAQAMHSIRQLLCRVEWCWMCAPATRIRGSSCGETCAISVADAPELLRSSMSAGNAFNQATALQGWMMLNVCSKAWHRDIGWEVSVCMICMGVYSDCMCWNWQFMITIPGRPHVIVSKRYIKELDYSSRIMYIICI